MVQFPGSLRLLRGDIIPTFGLGGITHSFCVTIPADPSCASGAGARAGIATFGASIHVVELCVAAFEVGRGLHAGIEMGDGIAVTTG